MTVREAAAFIILFENCTDPDVRRRCLKLVPELEDFVDDAGPKDSSVEPPLRR